MSALGPSLPSTVMGGISRVEIKTLVEKMRNRVLVQGAGCVAYLPARVPDIGIHIARVLGSKIINSWFSMD